MNTHKSCKQVFWALLALVVIEALFYLFLFTRDPQFAPLMFGAFIISSLATGAFQKFRLNYLRKMNEAFVYPMILVTLSSFAFACMSLINLTGRDPNFGWWILSVVISVCITCGFTMPPDPWKGIIKTR